MLNFFTFFLFALFISASVIFLISFFAFSCCSNPGGILLFSKSSFARRSTRFALSIAVFLSISSIIATFVVHFTGFALKEGKICFVLSICFIFSLFAFSFSSSFSTKLNGFICAWIFSIRFSTRFLLSFLSASIKLSMFPIKISFFSLFAVNRVDSSLCSALSLMSRMVCIFDRDFALVFAVTAFRFWKEKGFGIVKLIFSFALYLSITAL